MKRIFLTAFLAGSFTTNCQDNINICELDINIGNGLTMNPKNKMIVLSKPTGFKDKNDKNQYSIFYIKESSTKEIKSVLIPNLNSKYTDYHPVFSSKGDFIVFNSTRPKPKEKESNGKVDIYISYYKNNKFLKPKYLNNINTEFHDSYPTLTKTNKIYFNSDRPGGKGMMDIYVSEYKNNKWLSPTLVPELNSEYSENDLIIDPDEKFIIFNRYIPTTKEIDLLISFKTENSWSKPKSIKSVNKQGVWELTPTISLNKEKLIIEINNKIECFDLKTILDENN